MRKILAIAAAGATVLAMTDCGRSADSSSSNSVASGKKAGPLPSGDRS